MVNYIPDIAQIRKENRLYAIARVLKENGIPYTMQALPYPLAIGNLIVTLHPESTAPKTVISAHYDNFPGSPASNDNAAACSILLNLILALRDTDKHLEFVFFDLEEHGCIGSQHYVLHNKEPIELAFNLDMCGMGENTCVAAYHLTDCMKAKYVMPYLSLRCFPDFPLGDAHSFEKVGIPTLYIINSTDHDLTWFENAAKGNISAVCPDFARTMHRPNDTPDTLNTAQVEEIYTYIAKCLQ